MDDSFRISSNDNKIPDLSLQKTTDSTINAIRSMDPSTAFIAVKTVVLPTLSKLSAPPSESTPHSSPMELSKRQSQSMGNSSFKEITTSLDRIKSDLQDIQRLIKESESQTKNILDRDLLKKRAIALQEKITHLEKSIPKNPLMQSLHRTVKELLDTIPKLDHKDDKGTLNAKNLELSAENKKRFAKSLAEIDKNLRDIHAFSSSKEYHLQKLKSLGTEAAYVYALNTFLPFLQSQSAATLEEKGNTMKQISKLNNKWNEIQEEIANTEEILKKLRDGKHVDDVYLDVTKIELYRDKSNNKRWIIATIKDPYHTLNIKINDKVEEFKKLLKEVKKSLPSSSKQLINVLDTSADQLILKKNNDKGWFNFNWAKGEFKFEIEAKNVDEFSDIDFNSMLPENKSQNIKELDMIDKDTMTKVIWDRLTGSSRFFIDSDQSKFKAYMDNIGQGITALTSISNMTQQEVQIATQYYNSLLSLQKNGFDSIMKVIQVAAKAPNH